jgi:hypothetical protein
MYNNFNFARIKKAAEDAIGGADRQRFGQFYERVEIFCHEKGVLIGGQVGINILTDTPIAIVTNNSVWDLYCGNPEQIARELAMVFAEIDDPWADFTFVGIKFSHREFYVSVGPRMLVTVNRIANYRGVNIIDLMRPTEHLSLITKKSVLCVSEELQLIDMYRHLYSPEFAKYWPQYSELEPKLYNFACTRLKSEPTGAGDFNVDKGKYFAFIRDSSKSSQFAIIGDYALRIMGLIDQPKRLQFITCKPIKEIIGILERKFGGARFTYNEYPLNIISDFQIMKYTVFDKHTRAVADIYNSSAFEMIPFWPIGGALVGNPWVIMRFMFIDIWVLKLLKNITENVSYLQNRILELVSYTATLRDIIYASLAADPTKFFQLDNFVGIWTSEKVQKKKYIEEAGGKKFTRFYPHKEQISD